MFMCPCLKIFLGVEKMSIAEFKEVDKIITVAWNSRGLLLYLFILFYQFPQSMVVKQYFYDYYFARKCWEAADCLTC